MHSFKKKVYISLVTLYLLYLLFQENKSFGATTICVHPLMYKKPCREHLPHVWLFFPFLSGSILNLTQPLSRPVENISVLALTWTVSRDFVVGPFFLRYRSRTGREPVMLWRIIRGSTNNIALIFLLDATNAKTCLWLLLFEANQMIDC